MNENPYTSRTVRLLLASFALLAVLTTAAAMRASEDAATAPIEYVFLAR